MKRKTKLLIVTGVACVVVALGACWVYLQLFCRLTAGPMLQQVGPSAFTVVWRTNRPGKGYLEVFEGDRAVLRKQADFSDGQFVARADGLAPGREYTYRIVLGKSGAKIRLGGPWTCKTDPGPNAAFRFVAFGDSGTGTHSQRRLGERMLEHGFDLAIHTGDLIYPAGEPEDYDKKFYQPYRELIARVPFMPSIGNHDFKTDDARPLLDAFVLPTNGPKGSDPERHYWFDFGCARFVAIDSDVAEAALRDRVVPWLEHVFESAGQRWRFVFLHHPAYTACAKRGPHPRVQQVLVPAWEAAGVDVVFCGHNHLYERSKPMLKGKIASPHEGIVYIVTGAGGASLYPAKPYNLRPEYSDRVYDNDYSFTRVDASPRELELQQITIGGRVVDRWQRSGPSRGVRLAQSKPAS
ncbi:MAG: metallophosphoesterase [Phycisphaerae bacterium]|nr:metallophosphoesterase [Phycisphaerae bacterium]